MADLISFGKFKSRMSNLEAQNIDLMERITSLTIMLSEASIMIEKLNHSLMQYIPADQIDAMIQDLFQDNDNLKPK